MLLAAYCRRATGLLAALSDENTPPIRRNLSAEFGQDANFSLRDEVITVGFAHCLPVWPEWRTQIFEEQLPAYQSPGEPTLARELTYHFRVDGPVPETSKPSFDTRLERIENDWLCLNDDAADSSGESAEPREQRVNRSLAEVVFLWAVVPEGSETPADSNHALEAARRVARDLEKGGRPAVRKAIRELQARSGSMRQIARALAALLQLKGALVTRARPIGAGITT